MAGSARTRHEAPASWLVGGAHSGRPRAVAVPGALAGWLVAVLGPKKVLVNTLFNGVTLAGLYFLVASGFTLVFGLMRNVNLAHGSLYLFGAYVGYDVANWTGYLAAWRAGRGFLAGGARRRADAGAASSGAWRATTCARRL